RPHPRGRGSGGGGRGAGAAPRLRDARGRPVHALEGGRLHPPDARRGVLDPDGGGPAGRLSPRRSLRSNRGTPRETRAGPQGKRPMRPIHAVEYELTSELATEIHRALLRWELRRGWRQDVPLFGGAAAFAALIVWLSLEGWILPTVGGGLMCLMMLFVLGAVF